MSTTTSAIRVPPAATPGQESILERLLRNPRIPSPPGLALQILQKTGQEDCTVGEISELLAHDPGLCAKVLKTLNSAVYACSRPVTSIRQAVTMLGNRPLRSLVLGLALPAMQAVVTADAGLRRFWKKSVAGAVMARELATRCRMTAPDDEMATSLLRDLGMIVLQQSFADKYGPMWTGDGNILAEEQCDWEVRNLGVHHADVSAALLERWKLPSEIVEPIRFHHYPRRMPASVQQFLERALLLNFVTRLTELEERSQRPGGIDGILQSARERYGMERSGLEQFLAAVRPKVEEFSTILGVDIGDCPDFDELLASGCEQLVRASMETAANESQHLAAAERTMNAHIEAPTNYFMYNVLDSQGKLNSAIKIPNYDVVSALGRGAMGIVLKAYDAKLARHVAIKLLAPEMAGSEKARQRFALEARFAAGLRHEHVVAIHAVSELDGVPYLVMEYVNGTSLGDLLDDGVLLSVSDIARIGRQTALGLAAAHTARLIHRDIKPANILLEEKTLHVRVADFGLARAIDEDLNLSQPGMLLGTPNFMSPEQVDGKTLTVASDVFSLGSVLYTMCTNQLPFQSDSMSGLLHAVAEKQPIPIRKLNADIPDGMIQVVTQLHAKNPNDRPTSAEVAELLEPWAMRARSGMDV